MFVVINPGTMYETLFYGQVASVYVRSHKTVYCVSGCLLYEHVYVVCTAFLSYKCTMYVYTCVEMCRVCRNRGDPQWGDCCAVVSIVWTSSVSFWSHDRSVVPGVKLGASTSMHGASVEQIVITKKRLAASGVWVAQGQPAT